MTSDENQSQSRTSFFWPLLLSVLLVHLPLLFLLVFVANQPVTLTPAQQTESVPLMVDLSALPIVDMAKPEFEQIPDEAHALSTHNVKVEEETVNGLRNEPDAPPTQKSPPPPKKSSKTEPAAPKNPENLSAPSLSEVLTKLDQQQKQSEKQFDNKFKSQSQEPMPPFSKSNTGQGSFLPFYKVGNKTYINALAHPHVGYYIQINRKYEIAWSPRRGFDFDYSGLKSKKISSIWGLTISPSGELLDLVPIQLCGFAAYDNETKRTIQVSAPFGPPPPELLEGQPNLNVAWEFYTYFDF